MNSKWEIEFGAIAKEWQMAELAAVFTMPCGLDETTCSEVFSLPEKINIAAQRLCVPELSLQRFVGAWVDQGLLKIIDCSKFQNCHNFSKDVLCPNEFLAENNPNTSNEKLRAEYWTNVTQKLLNKDRLLFALKENFSQWKYGQNIDISEVFELYKSDSYWPQLFGRMFALSNEESDIESLKYIQKNQPKSVADVGGGIGAFATRARLIMGAEMEIDIFELPEAFEVFSDEYKAMEEIKIGHISLNFWTEVNFSFKKYNAVHLGWILHDWDDNKCKQVIVACRNLLSREGRLYISEALLNEDGITGPASFSNVLMLAMANGKERSLEEYRKLLSSARFQISNVISRKSGRSLIEATHYGL